MKDGEHSIILVDGKKIDGEPKDIYVNLLYQIDIKNSPMETIKENLIAIWDIIEEHCQIEHGLSVGKEKAAISRLLRTILGHRDFWLKISQRRILMKSYYDYILSFEQLGNLAGFRAKDRKGNLLYGNPEA